MNTPITIIGAGPAGLLLTHYLLRRGYTNIEIYESRQDPRLSSPDTQRTFPLALQARGRQALSKIENLEEKIAQKGTFCQGTLLHSQKGKTRSIPRKKPLLTIDRSVLSYILLEELFQGNNQSKLKIHFNHKCININSQEKSISFEIENQQITNKKYNILIGADGSNSQVRHYLESLSSFKCTKNALPDVYKSVYLPLKTADESLCLEPDKIHSIQLSEKVRILLVPQGENNLHGVIIFDKDNSPFEQFKNSSELLNFFQENGGKIGQLFDLQEVENLLKRPVAKVTTIECNQYHDSNNSLILGDAAHAVSPSLGQGCNSALEDVMIIDELLDKYQDNWDLVMPAFTEKRVPDAEALQQLSNYTVPRKKSLIFEYFLRLRISRLLNQWFPKNFYRPIFELVTETTLSYQEILQLHQGWINKVKQSQ